MQLLLAVVILKTDVGARFFSIANDVFVKLLSFTHEGSKFIFGDYLDFRFSIALKVLPTIIFFSALMSVLYHLGIMQRIVAVLAWFMHRTLGTSGAETLSASANIFFGQTEAPLVIRPYVKNMTRSELNAVMVGGFATVAGGVFALYIEMLHKYFDDIGGHLLAASVMSAPAALVVAKLMEPETEVPETAESVPKATKAETTNVIDAAAKGATEGMKLAFNVAAMLLAFLALLAMLNYMLGASIGTVNDWFAWQIPIYRFEDILGVLFWPLAWLMGVPTEECMPIASLLGQKMILTEFVAYQNLAAMMESGVAISERSAKIASYALCGFANVGSIGIQIGGIGAMAPERQGDLAKIGMKAMFGGMIAACITGSIAGALL